MKSRNKKRILIFRNGIPKYPRGGNHLRMLVSWNKLWGTFGQNLELAIKI